MGGRNASLNITQEQRALMLAQEIKELPSNDELLFFEGSKPIRCQENWFFKDKMLKARILDPVKIPPLALERNAQKAQFGSGPQSSALGIPNTPESGVVAEMKER